MATFKTFFGASSAAPRVGTQLDPAKTSGYITLSNANLTATRNAGTPYYAPTLSESSALSGSCYVEVTNTTLNDSGIGISNAALSDSDGVTGWMGSDTNSIALYVDSVWYNGANVGTFIAPPLATDVIGTYVDRTAQQAWFHNTRTAEWVPGGPGFSIASLGSGPLYFGFSLSYPDAKTVNFDGVFVNTGTAPATRWDGSPIAGAAAYTLTATTGALALAGTATGLNPARVLAATTSALALTGNTANFPRGYALGATPGVLALTGTATGLNFSGAPAGFTLTATAGALALAGTTTGFLLGLRLTATTAHWR